MTVSRNSHFILCIGAQSKTLKPQIWVPWCSERRDIPEEAYAFLSELWNQPCTLSFKFRHLLNGAICEVATPWFRPRVQILRYCRRGRRAMLKTSRMFYHGYYKHPVAFSWRYHTHWQRDTYSSESHGRRPRTSFRPHLTQQSTFSWSRYRGIRSQRSVYSMPRLLQKLKVSDDPLTERPLEAPFSSQNCHSLNNHRRESTSTGRYQGAMCMLTAPLTLSWETSCVSS